MKTRLDDIVARAEALLSGTEAAARGVAALYLPLLAFLTLGAAWFAWQLLRDTVRLAHLLAAWCQHRRTVRERAARAFRFRGMKP